jgi:hypothetical protein
VFCHATNRQHCSDDNNHILRLQACYFTDFLQVRVKVTLLLTVGRSVSPSVHLGVQPLWGSWPDSNYCLTAIDLSVLGSFSDEDGSVICPSQSEQNKSFIRMYYSLNVVNMYIVFSFTRVIHSRIYYIRIYKYTRPLSAQAENRRSCPVLSSWSCNGSIVTWTVVCFIAAKFKPLIFSVSGFALSNIANIFIFMILYDLCLLPS